MRRTKLEGQQGIYEVNMTPLIDVSLVLVVILLVATPIAFQSSISVQRAAASGAATVEMRSERIEIAITSADSLQVNRRRVANADLAATLRPLLAASATRRVVVQCALGVTHGSVVQVLDEAKHCGAAQIAVSTR